MSLLARLSLPDIDFSSFEAVLKPNEKAAGYFHNIHATAASMGISYHSNHYCSSQRSQLNKTTDGFSSQQYTNHLSTPKAS